MVSKSLATTILRSPRYTILSLTQHGHHHIKISKMHHTVTHSTWCLNHWPPPYYNLQDTPYCHSLHMVSKLMVDAPYCHSLNMVSKLQVDAPHCHSLNMVSKLLTITIFTISKMHHTVTHSTWCLN
ncbi:hypothetical protein RRG08_066498 [Elysia crispata]|uniref:Uncharacterized protein n=1 Tax=Elysia crispata TaxID=231223 RepID=A0AAE1D492_9GAST|nr:hypothetical protein RRG08_066498 [Elysia crispata]